MAFVAAKIQRREFLQKLKTKIEKVQLCAAVFERTELVTEKLNGETIWECEVEVFWITSPTTKAKRCYGWELDDTGEFLTMLQLPPIDSAQAAIQAALPAKSSRPAN
jgi:hypothetical protein